MTDSKRTAAPRAATKRKPRAPKTEKEPVVAAEEKEEVAEEPQFADRERDAHEAEPEEREERWVAAKGAPRAADDRDAPREEYRDRDRERDRDEDYDDRDRDRDYDRGAKRDAHDDEDRDDYERPATAEAREPARALPSDKYIFQIYYDDAARNFTGSVIEVPEIKATGYDRHEVSTELENRLEAHLLKVRGKAPEAYSAKTYPEKLEARISQNLFRRLDLASRQEKVPLDQLVTELLTNALDRKDIGGGRNQHQPNHNQNRHHNRDNRDNRHSGNRDHGGGNRDHGGGGNRHHSQGQRDNQGNRSGGNRRNYNDTLNNRENFMEYVRNLEKGGGTPPAGYKKR